MDKQEAKQVQLEMMKLNLKVLRYMDQDIERIVFISSYCSLHELDKASKIWHACETAGPFFLVKRASNPALKMILLNQKSTIDFDDEVYANQKIELKESENFLFFMNKMGTIKGLWISNVEELKQIYKLIMENIAKLE